MSDKLEKLKDKIIELLEKVSERTFMDFVCGWLGEERIFEEMKESIEDYEDIVVLEDLYKELNERYKEEN